MEFSNFKKNIQKLSNAEIGGLEAQKMELLNQVAQIKEMLNEFQADLEKSYGKVSVSLVDGTISEDADNKED